MMAKQDGLRFTESSEDSQIGICVNGTEPVASVVEARLDAKGGSDANSVPSSAISEAQDDDSMFDPERIRLDQNFTDDLGVKTILTVRVRKPGKQTFFRVHPSPDYRLIVPLLELQDDRETYLVERSLVPLLGEQITSACLFTCIDRNGNVFLWAVKLPAPDGRSNDWHSSTRRIAELAMTKWARMQANMSAGCYEAFEAAGKLPEPDWPPNKFQDFLKGAFQDRFIRDLDHPVLKKLRGEI